MALHERIVPATINLDNLDDGIEVDLVDGTNRAAARRRLAAVNNSFGFGGHNVASSSPASEGSE